MLILNAIKHTPLGLKISNGITWIVIVMSQKIGQTIDFLNPEVAQSISLYSASILSIITAVIAIKKEIKRGKNAKIDS